MNPETAVAAPRSSAARSLESGTASAPVTPLAAPGAPEAAPFDREAPRRSPLAAAVGALLLGAIRLYQWTLGPLLFAGACRFSPSCSRYGAEAIRQHGPWRGVALLLRRLSRCRPFGGSGYDPVPDARR